MVSSGRPNNWSIRHMTVLVGYDVQCLLSINQSICFVSQHARQHEQNNTATIYRSSKRSSKLVAEITTKTMKYCSSEWLSPVFQRLEHSLNWWHQLSVGTSDVTEVHYSDLCYKRRTKSCSKVSDSSIRFVSWPRVSLRRNFHVTLGLVGFSGILTVTAVFYYIF